MAFLKSSELFTYVTEATPGAFDTDVSITDVDIRLRDLEWATNIERDNDTSKFMTGTWFGADESIVGKKTIEASYNLKLAPGQFTAETDPGVSGDAVHTLTYTDLLNNCGLQPLSIDLAVTDNAAGIHAFYPDQTNSEATMSMARVLFDPEENIYQIEQSAGAMSNFTIAVEGTAAPFNLELTSMGRAEGIVEIAGGSPVASLDTANVMRTVADSLRNTTVKITDLETLTETVFCISAMTMESGNEINEKECQTGDSGIQNYFISEPAPTMVIDPLLRTEAAFNWWDAVSQERFYSVEIDSEYVSIYIPRAQINENAVGESNMVMRNELTFRALINIDGDYPTWLPVGDVPTNVADIPYFIGIGERAAQY